jgi:hypothetical protein
MLCSKLRVFCAAVVILAAATSARADTIELGWNPSPDASVAGYIVYVGRAPGTYNETYDVGNTTVYTYPSAVGGQRYYFAVAAYDRQLIVGPKSQELSGTTNEAPLLTPPANQTSMVGEFVNRQLVAEDPESRPLLFGATGLPPGLSVASSTGVISGAAQVAGTYSVTVTASDGTWVAKAAFTWTIQTQAQKQMQSPPSVTIISPTNNSAFAGSGFFYGSAADAEDGTISSRLTWASNVDGALGIGASFNRVLSPGKHIITATVTDSAGLSASSQVSVTIPGDATTPPPVNTAPTASIASPTGGTFAAGAGIVFSGSATDNEDGSLASRLVWTSSIDGPLGTGASFTKVLSAGAHVITASVTDSGGLAASRQVSISVLAPNTAPVVSISSPTSNTFPAGASIAFAGSATDSQDGNLASRLAWTSSIDGSLGIGASFTKALSAGTHLITASVTDSGGLSASRQLSLTIGPPNPTPTQSAPSVTIISPTNNSTFAGSGFFYGSASDPEDGTISSRLKWTSSIDGALGTGGWFDRVLSPGKHIITATVTDSGGLSASSQVSVTIQGGTTPPPPVNTAPTVSIASPTGGTAAAGASIVFSGSAVDNEDGSLTARLAWTSSIDGPLATGSSFTRALSPGTHIITAAVTDNGGLSASRQVSLSVSAPNTAPVVSIASPTGGTVAAGTSIAFAGSATDSQDGSLASRLAWTSSIDGPLGTGGSFTKVLSAGAHVITASVTDSGGLTASRQVSISVLAPNTAPVVSI